MKRPIEVHLNHAKLIAHRGLSGVATENTMEAFTLAGEYGYYGIECDIHVTKDHEFVVFHDYTLDRMTDKEGFIKDLTVDEIKELEIVGGHKIPLLREYLDICIKYQSRPVIEIKDIRETKDLDHLINLLKDYQMINEVYIISFRADFLIYLRNKSDHLPIALIVNNINEENMAICKKHGFDIDTNVKNISIEQITECHKNGLLVNVYTLDDDSIAQSLDNGYIDFITSNILYEKKQS